MRAQLLLASALALTACAERRERSEAERILTQLERMRAADGAERDALLRELEQQAAPPLAERARERCSAAYRALGDAQTKLAAAQKRVGPLIDPERGRAAALELEQADKQLARAEQLMPECRQAVAELRKALFEQR